MFEANGCQAYVDHMRAEHRRLKAVVKDVQAQLRHLDQVSPAERAPDRLSASLVELRRELAQHFEEEETGGCLEEAVSRRPQLASVVREIEQQHPELLRELDRIIEGTRVVGQLRIKLDFDAFSLQLLAHEAMETRMLEKGFNVALEADEL